MRMALAGALAAVLCLAVQGSAQDPVTADSTFVAALRTASEAATARGEFSGAVLVIRDGRTLFEGAYGLADRERGITNGGAARGMSGELAFEPNGGYVAVALSNFDPPAAMLAQNFILANVPPTSAGGAGR